VPDSNALNDNRVHSCAGQTNHSKHPEGHRRAKTLKDLTRAIPNRLRSAENKAVIALQWCKNYFSLTHWRCNAALQTACPPSLSALLVRAVVVPEETTTTRVINGMLFPSLRSGRSWSQRFPWRKSSNSHQKRRWWNPFQFFQIQMKTIY